MDARDRFRLCAGGLLLGLAAAACGAARHPGDLAALQVAEPAPLWPLPPEPARIRLIGSLAMPSDVGVRRSMVRRVVDALTGRREPRLRQPYAVSVDSSGRVVVGDMRARAVHLFDVRRRAHEVISRVDGMALAAPAGVASDGAGNLYVADAELGVVFALDAQRRLRWRLDGLRRPTGLALHPTEPVLYVVETQGHRVRLVNARDGAVEHAFGQRGDQPGEFNFPTNVAVGADGEVYITDSMNFRVQMFGSDGAFVALFGRPGDAVGDLARPKGIGVDSEGHIYVVDGLYDVVNIYSRTGRILLSFGGAGHAPGQFWLAAGLAMDDRDRVYVADSFNGRVQVFQYLRVP